MTRRKRSKINFDAHYESYKIAWNIKRQKNDTDLVKSIVAKQPIQVLSKEELDEIRLKAAAFDWLSENLIFSDFFERDGGGILVYAKGIDFLLGEGKDLLEAVQNAMEKGNE